jgi:hypothetical protein
VEFPDKGWIVDIPEGIALTVGDVVVEWTIYLDDAPPASGEIDVASTRM